MARLGVIASTPVSDTSPLEFTMDTEASDPGQTCHSPPVPLGVGTVNVTWLSLHESTVNVAEVPGAPQLVPRSLSVTYPLPWLAPNPDPVTVTCRPAGA